jgi:essential nuclear protein 1
MGKISIKDSKDKVKHVPLYRDIAATGGKLKSSQIKAKVYKQLNQDDDNNDNDENDGKDEFDLDAATSRRVLKLAREQQQEIEDEENFNKVATKPRFQLIQHESDNEDQENENNDDDDYEQEEDYEVEYVDEDDLNPSEIAMFETFFKAKQGNNEPFQPINLADKIMEKIAQASSGSNQIQQNNEGENENDDYDVNKRHTDRVYLPPRVIEAYQKVGESLRAWKHGKLPKLFKVLPTIKNWEDLLYVTAPESWTPNAVYEATRLFVSNLTASKAEKFVSLVLYPRFRQDIEENEDHKLNYHIYRALKKSLYKPAAFFKGFLFQLVEDQCSVREAMIAASVLKKTSVPVQHAAVALSWLLEQEFSPAATVFIRVLIEKKYALPYQTIDDLVFYFMRFRIITDNKSSFTINNEMDDNYDDILADTDIDISQQRKLQQSPPLPLVWHKSLLAFSQRYKNDITDDQRDFLMEVIRQRGHKEIGPEIRRELLAGKPKEFTQQPQQQQQKVDDDDDDIMSYF